MNMIAAYLLKIQIEFFQLDYLENKLSQLNQPIILIKPS